MKKTILFLFGLGVLLTSCETDGDKPAPDPVPVEPTVKPNPDYKAITFEEMVKGFKFIDGVSTADVTDKSISDMNAWVAELNVITKNLVKAEEGKAGYLPDGEKKRFLNAKGVETEQLIKKGLIGALQLNKFNEASRKAIMTKDVEECKKALAEAKKYLLGTATNKTTKDEYKKAGNAFGKYMMSTAGSTKYKDIHIQIFDLFEEAEKNTNNAGLFANTMTELNKKVTTVVAFRAVHYMAKYAEKIREDFTGKATHELSEGLGFAYSLQYAYTGTHQSPFYYLTAKEAKKIADVNLWTEAKDKSGKSLLDTEAERIAEMFGFTVAQAKE